MYEKVVYSQYHISGTQWISKVSCIREACHIFNISHYLPKKFILWEQSMKLKVIFISWNVLWLQKQFPNKFYSGCRQFVCPVFCNKFTSQRVKYKAEGILGIPDTCHCKGKNSFYHHWPTSWFIVRNFSTINCWFAFYFKWRVVVNWFLESLFRLSWKLVCTSKHLMPIESWEIGDSRELKRFLYS